MANEIRIQSGLQRKNASGSVIHDTKLVSLDITQTTKKHIDIVKAVTTTEVSIDPSALGISTNGLVWMRNLDATNYVQWGVATTDYAGRMRANEVAGPFRAEPGKTIYLKANTATCNVQFVMYED